MEDIAHQNGETHAMDLTDKNFLNVVKDLPERLSKGARLDRWTRLAFVNRTIDLLQSMVKTSCKRKQLTEPACQVLHFLKIASISDPLIGKYACKSTKLMEIYGELLENFNDVPSKDLTLILDSFSDLTQHIDVVSKAPLIRSMVSSLLKIMVEMEVTERCFTLASVCLMNISVSSPAGAVTITNDPQYLSIRSRLTALVEHEDHTSIIFGIYINFTIAVDPFIKSFKVLVAGLSHVKRSIKPIVEGLQSSCEKKINEALWHLETNRKLIQNISHYAPQYIQENEGVNPNDLDDPGSKEKSEQLIKIIKQIIDEMDDEFNISNDSVPEKAMLEAALLTCSLLFKCIPPPKLLSSYLKALKIMNEVVTNKLSTIEVGRICHCLIEAVRTCRPMISSCDEFADWKDCLLKYLKYCCSNLSFEDDFLERSIIKIRTISLIKSFSFIKSEFLETVNKMELLDFLKVGMKQPVSTKMISLVRSILFLESYRLLYSIDNTMLSMSDEEKLDEHIVNCLQHGDVKDSTLALHMISILKFGYDRLQEISSKLKYFQKKYPWLEDECVLIPCDEKNKLCDKAVAGYSIIESSLIALDKEYSCGMSRPSGAVDYLHWLKMKEDINEVQMQTYIQRNSALIQINIQLNELLKRQAEVSIREVSSHDRLKEEQSGISQKFDCKILDLKKKLFYLQRGLKDEKQKIGKTSAELERCKRRMIQKNRTISNLKMCNASITQDKDLALKETENMKIELAKIVEEKKALQAANHKLMEELNLKEKEIERSNELLLKEKMRVANIRGLLGSDNVVKENIVDKVNISL